MQATNLKTACVKFSNEKYNYMTSVNGNLTDDEIKNYFIGKYFNLGNSDKDDMQKCVSCEIIK